MKYGGSSSCWLVLLDSSFLAPLSSAGSLSLLVGFDAFDATSSFRVMVLRPTTTKEDISGGGGCAAA